MTKFGTSSKIPKIIHFLWIGGEIPKDRKDNPQQWQDLNPDYEIRIWDEIQLTDKIDKELLKEYEKIDTPVKKSDFARMWILSKYGGWYADYDLIPRRSFYNWFNDELIFGRLSLKGEGAEPVNYNKYDYILTKEYRKIDKNGIGVANGIIGTIPSNLWIEFLESRFEHRDLPTLKSYGPHALTYFLRPIVKDLNAIAMPPHYFLWERAWFGNPAPYCISEHPSENTWGDKSKKDWWNT